MLTILHGPTPILKGNLLNQVFLSLIWKGSHTGQSIKIIEAEAIALVNLAVKINKPLVLEKLNTTRSKVSNPYGNRKANRKMTCLCLQSIDHSH